MIKRTLTGMEEDAPATLFPLFILGAVEICTQGYVFE